MSYECNNVSACHHLVDIFDGDSGMRVLCKDCKRQYVIRKDSYKRVPEIRQYVKMFRKDALQGNDNLFYKYHDNYLVR